MNLGQLRTAIQAMGYPSDAGSVAAQNYAINQVYRGVANERYWPWLEKQSTTLTLTIGVPTLSVASIADFANIDQVRIEIGTEYDSMEYLPIVQFRDIEHGNRDNGTPYYWAFFDQQLHFYPRPDQPYKVDIDYILQPPDLVLDTDVPLVPVGYHDMLVWGAIEVVAFRERDWLGRQFALTAFKDRHMSLVDSSKQRQTTSHVKASGYWDAGGPIPWAPWAG